MPLTEFAFNFAALLSYEAPNNGPVDCLMVRSTVGRYDEWVHWAFVVDTSRSVTAYVDGVANTAIHSSTSWCGTQGGTLYLGQSRNPTGAGFNVGDAPRVAFDSLRVHRVAMTALELLGVASGGAIRAAGLTRTAFWDAWCFSNDTSIDFDAGTQRKDLTLVGGSLIDGLKKCTMSPMRGAIAWRRSAASFAATQSPWQAPNFPFTIEAWVIVRTQGKTAHARTIRHVVF